MKSKTILQKFEDLKKTDKKILGNFKLLVKKEKSNNNKDLEDKKSKTISF